MKTEQVYYKQPYLKELDCIVISITDAGDYSNVILDQTVFFPEGGGQPSDRGTLGEARVKQVRLINGEIIHQTQGELREGVKVHAKLDWEWRYKYMKIHTCGHLLHDVLMIFYPDIVPIRASHGKKAFIEYKGKIEESQKETIEHKVNEVLKDDLSVLTKEASYKEISDQCQFVPPSIFKNKPLRMIKIGNFPAMPDGGVHVKSTAEIGKVWIANIIQENGITRIGYRVG